MRSPAILSAMGLPGGLPGVALAGALLVAGSALPASAAAPEPPGDGYLSRRVEILVYPNERDFERSERGLTLEREITLFEGYLWRHSLRHLSVEAHATVIHRDLSSEEFRNYGEQFGYLLDLSPRIESDLRERSLSHDSLILLYDSPADRPSRLAGRTFFEGSHSSIPLRDSYFRDDGFSRPLHLVMAHEFLHQIDLAFSRLGRSADFLDPDAAGSPEAPPCIDSGGGDLSLRSLLQYNRECRPVRWDLLAPAFGIWVPR
jgi:hypothetical protein